MNIYKVGQVVDNFINHPESTQFDIRDDGAILIVFFEDPTDNEKEQFKSGNSFEIRFTEMKSVIMVTTKIGNLNWMDAPYNVHLSKNLTNPSSLRDNQGMGLTLMLVNAINGKIEHIRFLGLSQNFSQKLINAVSEQKMCEFDSSDYYKNINTIFATYTTNQIVKMSKNYCKINE